MPPLTSLQIFLRWVFLAGFVISVIVGMWTFINITRMKREQAAVLGLLELLTADLQLKQEIAKMHRVLDANKEAQRQP